MSPNSRSPNWDLVGLEVSKKSDEREDMGWMDAWFDFRNIRDGIVMDREAPGESLSCMILASSITANAVGAVVPKS